MTEDFIDASGARQTVTELRMTGMSLLEIADRRLVPVEVMRALINGRDTAGGAVSEIAYRHYESLVKAPIPPTRLPEFPERGYEGMVLSFGTVRRLRALMALGHCTAYLAQRVGGSPSRLSTVLNPWVTGQVTAEGAVRVYRLHQTLRLIEGPSEPDRIEGKLRGWDIWLDADPDDFDRVVIDDYGYIENDPAVR
ncbi:hypothetical protein [Mycobacteroides abscessus]|uniref:hypothetical protein n=1 Tax=Mycobacteroides abscessus TaxID=36809 RepID=UPI000925C505|nr:hypothetical protein [Mycobacteroides abscessus]SIB66662.1 Uncharacterised protein [Mycobacteroides abscessus subsp. abscessus]